MQDPVVLLESGQTYERAHIDTWLLRSMYVQRFFVTVEVASMEKIKNI
jgi:hypothetical protein